MKIRILKPFAGYRAGQEFDWGDGMVRVLLSRGLIEQVESRIEAAVVEERAERAEIVQQPRKRVK